MLDERLYALRQCDSYGERYGILMFSQSRKGICRFTKPSFTSLYICVDRYVPISESHQQMQELMFYECLGHTGLSTNRCCFADYPNQLPMRHIRKGGALDTNCCTLLTFLICFSFGKSIHFFRFTHF